MNDIKNRFSGKIIVDGSKYTTRKEACEKNKNNLSNLDLSYSNLRNSDLSNSDLRYLDLRYSDLRYSNLSYSDLRYSNLRYSDLSYSNLSYSNLSNSDLRYSHLSNSNLTGIKRYSESHEVFQELVRIQPMKTFTTPQWSVIGQILMHRLCWCSIKKRYGTKFMCILEKLSNVGFNEFEIKYKGVLNDNN